MQSRYIPQLDSLRFFAVLLVMFSHWLGGSFINYLPNGFLGVTFFFVLSGYLISSNLLRSKLSILNENSTAWKEFGNFFLRRVIRIFPLFYFVLVFLYFIIPNVYEGNQQWYFLYCSNFLIFIKKQWPGMLSHFWSLAVEEQFYLFWPIVIILGNIKHYKIYFIILILVSLIYKMYSFHESTNFFNFYDVLPFSCFDAFGVGSLLALFDTSPFITVKNDSFFIKYRILLSAIASILSYVLGLSFLFGLLFSVFSVFIIWDTKYEKLGWFNNIVKRRELVYLGKISYGLYVYHNFIPWLLRCFAGTEILYKYDFGFRITLPSSNPVFLFIIQFGLLLLIASLSWKYLEKPILRLKAFL
ncbi:acyltransferase family protein [Flavihumibacter profundi]|uniref:acyltransferase family protein n=1 Tax=Flavihumibacter profundi TaxID=2716883 RepID=UPI001CC43F81|nr:acyltransferase [Flavihumibacter profundi]MBZ5857992.1 acyltransferase [Flavihumibacter profundi]